MSQGGEQKTRLDRPAGGWAWRTIRGADSVQIAVTHSFVALRLADRPDDLLVFNRDEWRALAQHAAQRDDV